MKPFLQALAALIIAIIVAVLAFLVGRYGYPKCPTAEDRADTVYIYDTVREPPPPPETIRVVRTERATLPITKDSEKRIDFDKMDSIFNRVSDSVMREVLRRHGLSDRVTVDVPIERKVYKTSDYRAEIEGFRPQLISMEVYRQTQFIDRTQTILVPDPRRWGIGVVTGYGMTVQDGRVRGGLFLGVGASYSLFRR
jgi:hypothetical protein